MSATKNSNGRATTKDAKVIRLSVFRQPGEIETDRLINGLWSIAKGALWMNRIFWTSETIAFRELIAVHFYNGKKNKQNFKELAERICLAKRHFDLMKGFSISDPSQWLDINEPEGLAATGEWLDHLKKDIPEYNIGISTFANTFLRYLDSPNSRTFIQCKLALIDEKQFDLLEIFHNTIINLQYEI